MRITLDFDKETLEDENGVISVPGLKAKEEELLSLIGVEKIAGEDLRRGIEELFSEIGINAKV